MYFVIYMCALSQALFWKQSLFFFWDFGTLKFMHFFSMQKDVFLCVLPEFYYATY